MALVTAALGACGDPGLTPPGRLVVREVSWNPTSAPVGTPVAVVEDGTNLVLFTDTGTTVFSGGVVALTDTTVTGWRDGTTIPAADGSGTTWIVGIDGTGQIHRLRADMTFESISDRYGLANDNVHHIASLGSGYVAFSLDQSLALSDGILVARYNDASFTDSLAGGSARAAGASNGMIRVFEAASSNARSFPLAGARFVAFDATGRLVVASDSAVYFENAQGALDVRYRGSAIHGLAVSGGRVWFAAGSELGTIEGTQVSITSGQRVSSSARLSGSPSGDVWLFDGPQLHRFACDSCRPGVDATWRATILPIFTNSCAQCHRPGGSAGVDLSTYDAWNAHRAIIHQRVGVNRDMPPPGNPLSDADRATIDMWVTSGM
jgi:hypothetical protein